MTRIPGAAKKDIGELAARLTERDFAIIAELDRRRTLTLAQLARMFFTSPSAARERLLTLKELGVLERFRPTNRDQYRYLLSHLGQQFRHAMLLEADEERVPDIYSTGNDTRRKAPTRPQAEQNLKRLVISSKRRHLEGGNDFYSRVVATTRSHPDVVLHDWVSERELREELYLAIVHSRIGVIPDGAGHLTVNGRHLTWWYEYDTGTETLSTLTDKARRYGRLYRHEGHRSRHMALFEITRPGREANFHQALVGTDVQFPVATTTAQDDLDPLAAIWWPLGLPAGARRPLTELPIADLPATPTKARNSPWNPK